MDANEGNARRICAHRKGAEDIARHIQLDHSVGRIGDPYVSAIKGDPIWTGTCGKSTKNVARCVQFGDVIALSVRDLGRVKTLILWRQVWWG